MTPTAPATVTLVEVAPRDGFQAVVAPIATEAKIAAVSALAATGVSRIEIGSFVSPKALPQMADVRAVLAGARLPAGVRVMALVPNARGLADAIEAGVTEVGWVVSVSESHNRNNVRASIAESFAAFEAAWRGLGREAPRLRFNLSTCFDCPFEGHIPSDRVLAAVERVRATAPHAEIAICDTTGRAATANVRSLMATLIDRHRDAPFAFHGHDTYGLGVANALAAYEVGVRVIDGAAAGLGGCPFAPGASGNTASEDLVFAFEHSGVTTGVDLARLLEAADAVAALAPAQAGGRVRHVPRARVLAGFGAGARGLADAN